MIHELVVLSGKGGTGKTSITASLAVRAESPVMADCDVDAADLHLLLKPEIRDKENFTAGKKAFIHPGLCTSCGTCNLYCRFDAIDDYYIVNELSCEGCGLCAVVCPAGAVEMRDHVSGTWFVSSTGQGTMVHAALGIAEGNSGKLVTLIKKKAHGIAEENGNRLIIVDGSPGIGCPVIATISGASSVLVVTEPTVAGIHDLERVYRVAERFRPAIYVCINKADINPEKTGEIKKFCADRSIPVVGEIPYDGEVSRAIVAGRPLVSVSTGPAAQAIKTMWQKLSRLINKEE